MARPVTLIKSQWWWMELIVGRTAKKKLKENVQKIRTTTSSRSAGHCNGWEHWQRRHGPIQYVLYDYVIDVNAYSKLQIIYSEHTVLGLPCLRRDSKYCRKCNLGKQNKKEEKSRRGGGGRSGWLFDFKYILIYWLCECQSEWGRVFL